MAQVAALANAPAVRRLAQLLPNDPPWQNCPVRVYWPRLPNEPSGTHPLLNAAEIEQQLKTQTLDQALLTKFIEFSAKRYREGELIRTARLAVDHERAGWRQVASTAERESSTARAEARQAQEERDRLRQECDTARQVIRSLQADLSALRDAAKEPSAPSSFDDLAAELERAWDDNRRLTGEIETERQQLAELREELRIHQENWALFAASRAADDQLPVPAPPSERTFATVTDAVRAAAEDFADVLLVWEDAHRSAELSPFRTPGKVFRALEAIAEVGRIYFQSRDGGPPLGPVEHAFACRVPFKYTGFESHTTLHLYGTERIFHHKDQSRQMQRHLTLGGGETNNCLQIYFEFDDPLRRVLIGYCGRHLPYHRQRT
jgi:macrodomain Ter protein organizer (MatP/YcbG family)